MQMGPLGALWSGTEKRSEWVKWGDKVEDVELGFNWNADKQIQFNQVGKAKNNRNQFFCVAIDQNRSLELDQQLVEKWLLKGEEFGPWWGVFEEINRGQGHQRRLKALARWKRGWGLGECLPRGRWKTTFELGDPRQCNVEEPTNKQTISDCSRKSKERSSTGFNSFLPPGKAVNCLRFPGSLIFFLITRAGEYHTAISYK